MMTDDDLAAIELRLRWPDYEHLLASDCDALLAEVKTSRERERGLRAGIEAIAARRCLCSGHTVNPPHGGPCCGVAGGRCVTCEARAITNEN